jgi:hypothetical protein
VTGAVNGNPMIRRIIILAAVLLLLAAFRAYRKKIRSASSDPNVFMPLAAEAAVAYASQHGKTLDYSPESIKTVETLLAELHDAHSQGNLPEKTLHIRALEFGGYIGEVLRRKYGGSWATDHSVAGPGAFPIHWKSSDSFPVGWCGKRILNGDEDNVWVKFQIVTSDEYQNQAIPTTRNDKNPDSSNEQ